MFDHKIIVFSDIHIVEASEEIIGIDPFTRFAEGLSHAVENHKDAQRIMIVGDLTHHGRVAQYERFRSLLQDLPIPVHLMLGNHDRRAEFYDVFPDAPYAHGFLQEAIDLGDTLLITLDTLDGPPYPERHHSGRLCEARLSWLEEQLKAAAGKRVILFFHHPPYDVGFPGMDNIKLLNGDELHALLARFPNVALLVNGHVHRTISGQWHGIPVTMFKSPAHQMPMNMVGTNSSSAVNEPGAYGLLCLTKDAIIIHTDDFTLQADPTVDGHSA